MAIDFRFYCSSEEQRRTIGDIMHAALKGSPGYINNEILLNIDQEQEGGKYPILLFVGESPDNTEDIDVRFDFDAKTQIVGRTAGGDQFVLEKKEEKVKKSFANFFRELNKCDRIQPFSTAYLESRPPLPQGYKYNRYDFNNGIRNFNYREFIAVDRILIDTENKDYIHNSTILDMILGTNTPCLYISPSNSDYVDISDDFGKVVNNSERNQIFDLMLAEVRFTPQNVHQYETQLVPTEFIFYNIVGLAGDFYDIKREFELQTKKSEFKMTKFLYDISKKLFTSAVEKPKGDES